MFNRIASTSVLFLVLSALTLTVQRDRVSGVWASDSRPLLELKAEGSTVSGTVNFYEGTTRRASAPIESGSFDGRTGRVTLDGPSSRSRRAHLALRDRRHASGGATAGEPNR
jgi:hypothetical protein